MKLNELYKESKRKNLTDRLNFYGVFKYYGYPFECKLCKEKKYIVIPIDLCSDCLLYTFKVKNNFLSKTMFKFIYHSLRFIYWIVKKIISCFELIKESWISFTLSFITLIYLILMITVVL